MLQNTDLSLLFTALLVILMLIIVFSSNNELEKCPICNRYINAEGHCIYCDKL